MVPGKIRSHRQLRAFVVLYMTKHFCKYRDFWDGLSPANKPMEGDLADYLKKLNVDKAWGGFCEIAAYASAIAKPVLVHAKDEIVHMFNTTAANEAVCL